ncbi:hypothetical protein GCM10023153_00030 [Ornithinibacter aureus]|uniref:N-acetyltransferase domain-containing protein n=2 Tax=Ornithinibacter aureus TaxID=622664 RepID=A0ABP8J7D9_9MICO
MPRTPRTWTVRPGTAEDASALQEPFHVVFAHDRGEEHHSWKFDANPAGPPVLAVAEDDGRLVGQYALWPVRLAVGSEVLLGAQSLDTMTHPDYRGQGMFTTLAKEAMTFAADRGVEVLFGFPNSASYPGFVTKLDWDHTGDVPHHSRVLRPSAHPRVPGWAGRAADLAARLIPSGARACLHKVSVVVGDCWRHVTNPGPHRRPVGVDLTVDAVLGWQAGQAFS